MNAFMEAVLTVAREEPSALARARLQRQLTPEEAARRAGLTPDEVEWLEEGRLYRFRSSERATVALLLYTTSRHRPPRGAPAGRSAGGARDGQPARSTRGRCGPRRYRPRDHACRCHPAAARKRRRPGRHCRRRTPAALADLRGRLERQRRHHVHTSCRRPDRLVRVPGQAREPRRPVRLPGDFGLLPARRREDRTAPRGTARRHRTAATGRQEPPPPGRDRRASTSPELERRPQGEVAL